MTGKRLYRRKLAVYLETRPGCLASTGGLVGEVLDITLSDRERERDRETEMKGARRVRSMCPLDAPITDEYDEKGMLLSTYVPCQVVEGV